MNLMNSSESHGSALKNMATCLPSMQYKQLIPPQAGRGTLAACYLVIISIHQKCYILQSLGVY
jgi:hypothetical protein